MNIEGLCCLKLFNRHPDLENVGSVKCTIAINGGTQGHNCDTENKPVIGRM